MNNFLDWIERPKQQSSPRVVPWQVMLYILLFGTTLFVFVHFTLEQRARWAEIKPVVTISPNSWKAYFGDSNAACSENEPVSLTCLAHPENETISKLGIQRTIPRTKQYTDAIHSSEGKVFWLGTTITHNQIEQALSNEALNLNVGTINGTFSFFLMDTL